MALLIQAQEAELAEARGLAAPAAEPFPVEQWIEAVLQDSAKRHAARTQDRFWRVATAFGIWARSAGIRSVAALNAAVAHAYLSAMSHKAKSTQRTELAILAGAWTLARARGWTSAGASNPFAIKIQVPKRKTEAYSSEEVSRLLSIQDPSWLRVAILVAYLTGARRESVRRLRSRDVFFDLGVIHFWTSKTGPYSVPLRPELAEALRARAEASEWIFPELQETDDSHLSTVFSRAADRVGVASATFHRIRHTFVTRLAECGVDERRAMLLANHKSPGMHSLYVHARAQELIPTLLKVDFGLIAEPPALLIPSAVPAQT